MPMNPRLLRPIANNIDRDAAVYLNAVAQADGQQLEPAVRKAINDFVVGCKRDNIWNAIKASCILAGARTLSGALVPLKGSAPTNNGPFVSGDYNRETGLVGNGTSKYLDTNRANNADPQNDNHNAVYVTTVGSSLALTSIENASFVGSNHIGLGGVNSRNDTAVIVSMQTGLNAHSRASSSAFQHRVGGVSQTHNSNSQTPTSGNLTLLRTSSLYGSHRIAFYSIGESLDLALLDTRVTALITAIGAAIP